MHPPPFFFFFSLFFAWVTFMALCFFFSFVFLFFLFSQRRASDNDQPAAAAAAAADEPPSPVMAPRRTARVRPGPPRLPDEQLLAELPEEYMQEEFDSSLHVIESLPDRLDSKSVGMNASLKVFIYPRPPPPLPPPLPPFLALHTPPY